MPVVAVVAGIASAAGGMAAFAAATTTLGSIAAGLSVVGGIATALGAVTGNKKLMKFGMIAGLGGAALGGLSALTSTAAESATSLSLGDTGLGLSSKAAGEGLQLADTGLSGLGNKATEAVGGSFGAGLGDSLKAVNGIDTGVSRMVAETAGSAAPAAGYSLLEPSTLNVPRVAQAPQSSFVASTGDSMGSAVDQLKIGANKLADTGASAFSGFGKFIGANPEVAKLGAGMLSGVGQGYMAQQQQKDAERMAADQRARINASITSQRQRY